MNFDFTDIKSILVSVAGSILFALVLYVFHGHWKNRREKIKEQKKQLEETAEKKEKEDFEIEKIRQQLSDANKLYANGLFNNSLEKCKDILAHSNVQKYLGLYWCVKLKEGNCYFELRVVDKYEENCLHSINSYLMCHDIAKQLNDLEVEGLTNLELGKSYTALSQIRSKEEYLNKAITHLKLALKQIEESGSSAITKEVQRFLAKAYEAYSSIKDKEKYLTLAIDAHRSSLSMDSANLHENDEYIRTTSLALTLIELSHLKDGEKNLEEAIRYFKKAADHISVEDHPSFLAETQANLACAYGHLSEIIDKQTNLDNAIAYTKESLEIYTPKDYPYFHALAKSNLGTLILNKLTLEQSETSEGEISEAINYILESLNMFSIKEYPLDYADSMIMLGEAYILISNYKNKQENIKNAISSYENAKKVYTLARYPDLFKQCSDSITDLQNSLLNPENIT